MSKTFTLFKGITAPKGQSTHDIYKIPTGRSAIVDISITMNYTLDSSSGSSSGSNISLNVSVVIKKQNGSSGLIGSDSFDSSNLLKLNGCILESGDTITISVNGIGVESLKINVAIGGILQ